MPEVGASWIHLAARLSPRRGKMTTQEPRKWTFPRRNAVMSGFARATVVVEASHTSGARTQARIALEHGRPVFLLEALLEHAWAVDYQHRPGTYVVSDAEQIVEKLDLLYAEQLVLVS